MTNAEVAEIFERIALILDIKGNENPFRIRAYERAALLIGSLSRNLRELYDEGGLKRLEGLPGIGKDLALKIEEILQTDKLRYLKKIEKGIPPGLLEILDIEGVGPKKTKLLWQKFKVKDIESLKKLAESGKLQKVKGWGEKTVQNILRGITLRKQMAGRLPIGDLLPLAEEIVEALKRTGLCNRIEIAGSLRRRRDTCGDIDILATSMNPEAVMEAFCTLPHVKNVTNKGKTKSTVFLKIGIDADLRVVEPDVFGAALHYFTGSKDHNVAVRKMAVRKGVTMSEYGVFKGTAEKKGALVAAHTEEEVFKTVGLPYIAPELRENWGEIEAAQKEVLPTLIADTDLQGDLHTHSTFSDGTESIVTMAKAAKAKGLQYIALTDHASAMGMVKGIKKETIKHYLKAIEDARRKVPGIHILAGAEVDILKDGSLYLSDDLLAQLDWVTASIHQSFRDSREANTARLIKAIQNPYVCAIGHPTTRILGKREPIDLNIDAVLSEAKKNNVAMELNASPVRLDLQDIHLKRAKELEATIVINSDAHSTTGLDCRYGIMQARRGWLEKHNILNTKPWEELAKWLEGRKGKE
ncbi:hypothetical protein A2635_02000 [Candidatus Peribacteria bacterium RIFCSPHIGHO2_01_FULL_51_9]|nr:MAG: hypothetical protein A2635_02000 [Candidatus Peribacteria bacterium RIFCSPHIGHO2_01_FULL_51_9]